jgi:hypothetical protein
MLSCGEAFSRVWQVRWWFGSFASFGMQAQVSLGRLGMTSLTGRVVGYFFIVVISGFHPYVLGIGRLLPLGAGRIGQIVNVGKGDINQKKTGLTYPH